MNYRTRALAAGSLLLFATGCGGGSALPGGGSWGGSMSASADARAPYDAGWGYDSGASSDAGAVPPFDPNADAGAASDVPPPYDAGDAGDAGPAEDASEPREFTCEDITERTPLTLYMSADDSNSAASPAIARSLIRRGQPVPPRILRTYEFLNYYNVQYQPAEPGTVRVVPQMRPSADPERVGEYDLVVGVQSERRANEETRPLVVTFVLDTSGSMAGEPIERQKAVIRAIAARLRRGDVVNATTWNTARRTVLSGYAVSGPNDATVLNMANNLNTDGGTDLHGGLVAGYELAHRHFRPEALNRVVLVSDGIANVGTTDEELIGRESHRAEGEELYLVGVGVGDGVNDTLMNTVTDRGRGAYVYIDTNAEAERAFGERFLENMDIAVRGVRLELTLPWYARVQEFHGEQISTNAAEVDPQHLAPNDSMVFHSNIRACSATVMQPADPITVRATYEDRVTREAREVTVATTMGALLMGTDAELRRANAIVAYAEALRDAGLALGRYDNMGARRILTNALSQVQAARVPNVPDERGLGEIESLLNAYLASSTFR